MSAEIAHCHPLSLRALDQTPHRRLIEDNFQSVLAAEFLGKLTRTGFEHLRLQLLSLGHQPVEQAPGLAHQRRSDTQLTQARPGTIMLAIAKQLFKSCE